MGLSVCLPFTQLEMTTTTHRRKTLLEMFTDNTAGESYAQGRLQTVETESGSVALVAYGWLKLAEYNERREAVTIFTGHKSLGSSVLTRYINSAKEVAKDRRNVILSGESPTIDQPNEGTKFIGNYVNFSTNLSSVEKDAVNLATRSINLLV